MFDAEFIKSLSGEHGGRLALSALIGGITVWGYLKKTFIDTHRQEIKEIKQDLKNERLACEARSEIMNLRIQSLENSRFDLARQDLLNKRDKKED